MSKSKVKARKNCHNKFSVNLYLKSFLQLEFFSFLFRWKSFLLELVVSLKNALLFVWVVNDNLSSSVRNVTDWVNCKNGCQRNSFLHSCPSRQLVCSIVLKTENTMLILNCFTVNSFPVKAILCFEHTFLHKTFAQNWAQVSHSVFHFLAKE